MEGVVLAAGRSLPAFAGYGSSTVRYGSTPGRRSPAGFAASADLMNVAQEALRRYQNAIDVAQEKCDSQSGWAQTVFNWVTGNTSTVSICTAVEQMRTNYAEYSSRIVNPWVTDDQLAEIISFVNKETDIRDLMDLAASTGVWTVTGNALLRAPGTAVGLVGGAAGTVLGGILSNIPWWAWLGGAGYLAWRVGVFGGAARRIRERVK